MRENSSIPAASVRHAGGRARGRGRRAPQDDWRRCVQIGDGQRHRQEREAGLQRPRSRAPAVHVQRDEEPHRHGGRAEAEDRRRRPPTARASARPAAARAARRPAAPRSGRTARAARRRRRSGPSVAVAPQPWRGCPRCRSVTSTIPAVTASAPRSRTRRAAPGRPARRDRPQRSDRGAGAIGALISRTQRHDSASVTHAAHERPGGAAQSAPSCPIAPNARLRSRPRA